MKPNEYAFMFSETLQSIQNTAEKLQPQIKHVVDAISAFCHVTR